MATITKSIRLSIQDGVGVVGLTILDENLATVVARTTAGISRIIEGEDWGEYAKKITLPDGVDNGVLVWDYGVSSPGTSREFDLRGSDSGSSDAKSGGGIIHARIAYNSLAPDEYLEIIQGEEKILTFIVEADGRFDLAEAIAISVKLADPTGTAIVKNNASITRVTEELDVQVFRVTLTSANTLALTEGLLRIEISIDSQKAVLTHTLKVIKAL